ncbi:MAG TPA: hypothetical protein VGI39_16050, partial [Polyangiaceae bacterium]
MSVNEEGDNAMKARSKGRGRFSLQLGLIVALVPAAAAASDGPPPPHGWLSKWPVDDAQPASSIPSEEARNADPMEFGYWLQDLALKAERASKGGDHRGAAAFYGALAQAVPDRAVAYGKECEEFEALGDHGRAIDACGQALLRDGLTLRDYVRFVDVVVAKPGDLSEKEKGALSRVLAHVHDAATAGPAYAELACEVGAKTSDVALLEGCTNELAAREPNGAKTLSYEWSLAMARGRFDEAEALVAQAGAAGVGADGL